MPYKTPSGNHYHSVEGCYGAMEPCPAGGGLAPCSMCYGRGQGVIPSATSQASAAAGPGGDSYEEDLPGAYARKYENSVEGYPQGMFKTADGIIRNRYGQKLSAQGVKSFLDESIRLRDEQLQRISRYRYSRIDSPEYVAELDYLGQLELQVGCFQAAYWDATSSEYAEKLGHAEDSIPPIEPNTEDESFYEKRDVSGYVPKLLQLTDALGRPFEFSTTRLATIANLRLYLAATCSDVDMSPDYILYRQQLAREHWVAVPPCDRPQQWHLPPLLGISENSLDGVSALCDYLGGNQDFNEVHSMAMAVHGFSMGSAAMREAQLGDESATEYAKKHAAELEKYISLAPKWAGGTTWRGVSVPLDQVDGIMQAARNHGELQPGLGATSSWSSDYRVSKTRVLEMRELYADQPELESTVPVIFECPTQSQGTSIAHLAPSHNKYEQEVMVSKDARYRVVRSRRERDGIIHVTLEEVTD